MPESSVTQDEPFADLIPKDSSGENPFADLVPESTTATGAFGRQAAQGVLPSAAFAATAGEVFPTVTALAAETGPFAPVIGGVAALLAGGGAAALAKLAQRKTLETVAPETAAELERLEQQDIREHPIASFSGELASGLPSFRLAPGTVIKGAKVLPSVLRGTAGTAEKVALAKAGGRLAAGGIIGAATPLVTQGRAPTLEDIASGMAFVSLYGEPRWKTGPGVPLKPEESLSPVVEAPKGIEPSLRMAGEPVLEKQIPEIEAEQSKAQQTAEAERALPIPGEPPPPLEPSLRMAPEAILPREEQLAIAELQRSEAEAEAYPRRRDFPKALAEKTGQEVTAQIAEGVEKEVHPNKPLTENQLRIIRDSLVKSIAENRLSGVEKWADDVLRENRERLHSGVNPETIAALIVKGAKLIESGLSDIDSWTKGMVKEYGDAVRPYLKDTRGESVRTAAAFSVAEGKPPHRVEPPPELKKMLDEEGVIYGGSYAPIDLGGGKMSSGLHSIEIYDPVKDPLGRQTYGLNPKMNLPVEEIRDLIQKKRESLGIQSPKQIQDASKAMPQLEGWRSRPSGLQAPGFEWEYTNLQKGPSEGVTFYVKEGTPLKEIQTRADEKTAEFEKASLSVGGQVNLGIDPSQLVRSLRNLAADFKALRDRAPVKRDISALADAAENIAYNAGRVAGNSVRLAARQSDVADRAATFIKQAKGNGLVLSQWRDRMNSLAQKTDDIQIAKTAREASQAIDYAIKESKNPALAATKAEQELTREIQAENAEGMNVPFRDAYVPGRYEDTYDGGAIFGEQRGAGGAFKKAKVFDNYVDAISEGYIPKDLRLSKLVESRITQGQRMVQKRLWAEGFKDVSDPVTGEAVARDIERVKIPRPDGTTDIQERVPRGYDKFQISPGVNIAVRRGYSRLFDALTATSRIAASPVGKAIVRTEAALKHGLLFLDTFHVSRVLQAEAALRGGKLGYRKGLSILEYSDKDLDAAVEQNLIPKEAAEWARGSVELKNADGTSRQVPRRELAQSLLKNGLNVGRVHDALYSDVVRNIPGIGRLNRWIFEELTRGVMLESAMQEVERLNLADPSKNLTSLTRDVARDTNIFFGNLGRQGIFKDATFRDLARSIFLAPQWVESLIQKETRFAGRLGKGAIRFATGKPAELGTIGKGMATGLTAYLVGTQLLNLATRGKLTWQNEEEGHKLDAWIPDLTGKTPGFFISPFSVFAEITHDLIRYGETKPTIREAVAQIGYNKLSPMGRATAIMLTGEDPFGRKLTSTWDAAKTSAFQLVPLPIGVSPLVQAGVGKVIPGTPEVAPGAVQRQVTASFGFKTEPASSPASRIGKKAQQFLKDKGIQPGVEIQYTADPSYTNLRQAIRSGHTAQARRILTELRKTRSLGQIFESMRLSATRPFTGSQANEGLFYYSLSPQDRALYVKAEQQRWKDWSTFQKFIAEQSK